MNDHNPNKQSIRFIELKVLEQFIKLGTISKVSDNLHISQSSCSRYITALEEKLECSLFTRYKNEYLLTKQAIELYEPLMLILRKFSYSFQHESKWNKKLRLFMPVTSSYLTSKHAIPVLFKQHNILDIELITFTVSFLINFPNIAPLILNNMDLIMIRDGHSVYLDPNVWHKSVSKDVEMKLYSSNTYLNNAPKLEHPNDLLNHACIDSSDFTFNEWLFYNQNQEKIKVSISSTLSIDSEPMRAQAVDNGNGIAILSKMIIDGEERKDTVEVLPDYKIPKTSSSLFINNNCKHKDLDITKNVLSSLLLNL
jgi:DNA-binding transcriptional LysR family regulator